jgi:hypothetical protein
VYSCTRKVSALLKLHSNCTPNIDLHPPVFFQNSFEIQPEEMNDFCQAFLRKSAVRIDIAKSAAFILDVDDVKPSLCTDVSHQVGYEYFSLFHFTYSKEYYV